MADKPNQTMDSGNRGKCPLYEYGCKTYVSASEVPNHMTDENHVKVVFNIIHSEKDKHESAMIDAKLNIQNDTATASLNGPFPQLVLHLTQGILNHVPLPNEENKPVHIEHFSSNLESIDSSMRNLIINTDQNPNKEQNAQMYDQQQQLLVTIATQHMSTRMNQSADCINMPTSTEEDQNAESMQRIQWSKCSNELLQTELIERPISTDGSLIWRVDAISEKINNATCKKQEFIQSPSFRTAMYGYRFFARIYPNGKTDNKFVSFHIHLNAPFCGTFNGKVKFALVDLSNRVPLQHIIQCTPASLENVNDSAGFECFIDKNLLHRASSPYVHNDEACFIVYIEQTNEERLAGLSSNIRDALMKCQQTDH